jgi:hypothetical protein
MENEIKANLGNPEKLEKLYRDDRKMFKSAFDKIYPEIENTEPAKFWRARLEPDKKPEIQKSIMPSEIVMVIAVCLLTAFLIKIPGMFQIRISDTVFFEKYAALIVILGLTLYTFLIRKNVEPKKIIFTALAFLVPALYVSLLPSNENGDSLILAYIHLPLLMWFVYGIVYSGFDFKDLNKRIGFIRFNGDLAIVYALIAIAGGLLTGISIGLFESIGLDIDEFYAENIVMTGAAAAPVVAAFLIEKFPALVNKAAPLIATIFSPLVLLTLIIFLITIAVTGKDPYNDRNFLLIFNVMLLGVMGIIIFSVSETSVIRNQKFNSMILFILSIITILVDLIALSAIFYRLGEYGLTPNRIAVLVSNVLVLANLILIMIDLFRINFKKKEFRILEMTVAKFLPVYLIWIIIVVFTFPLIFGMK